MTDRELLEAAAKAAGYTHYKDHVDSGWNPLTSDGDALQLAVKLGLVVDFSRPSAGEPWKRHVMWLDETMSNEELTRRAIVRAAAEIGSNT